MARPLTCCSLCQNSFPTGKEEPAGPASTKGSDTYTPAPAVSRSLTPAPTPAPGALFAPAPINAHATIRYSETDLQQIFKTVLEARSPVPAPTLQPLVFPNSPCKRLLKAGFLELYCGKTHMECYNFIQQCEDHFAIAGAKGPNHVLFIAIFF